MNKNIYKFLFTGDRFMLELHLNEPGFTYSSCRPLTEHREKVQRFRETDNLKYLYRNKLDKACFAYDAGYSDSKDVAKRTISDKILKDKTYEIARNCNYNGYQNVLPSMVYKFFDKKTEWGIIVNEPLVEELYKPVIKKIKRRKVYARYEDNIYAPDLAEMEPLSSRNKIVKYLLCVIDFVTKYACVKPLKDKKDKTVLNAFIEMVNEFNCKPNNLWFDQGKKI